MVACNTSASNRRKLFWATQPEACGSSYECGASCGKPGLGFEDDNLGNRTLLTTDWLRGLILNMLMTDGRRLDNECGYNPNGIGGHWSESYGGGAIGTLIRTIEPKGSINQLTALIQAHAESTMSRLVTRGVALKVNCVASYIGSGKFSLAIEVFGRNNQVSKVGLSADRLSNGWIWS